MQQVGQRQALDAPASDQWNEKKGASELSKKLKPAFIQVIVNLSVFTSNSQTEDYFPRLLYLRLDESLIQAHLDILEYLKPLFTLFLEHKEGVSNCARKLYKQRKHVFVPERITTSTWNKMTLNQQYEAVFGGSIDPSRKKLSELPYFISIASRKRDGKCVYCQREQCTDCPLPLEEMTLREYLNMAEVSTQSYYYYEDHQQKVL